MFRDRCYDFFMVFYTCYMLIDAFSKLSTSFTYVLFVACSTLYEVNYVTYLTSNSMLFWEVNGLVCVTCFGAFKTVDLVYLWAICASSQSGADWWDFL